MIGLGTPVQTLPIAKASMREVDLVGSFRYAGEYRLSIEQLTKPSSFNYKDFITHRFKGFDSIPDAFETASKKEDKDGNIIMKVVIEFD